jgi:hypothetical protein
MSGYVLNMYSFSFLYFLPIVISRFVDTDPDSAFQLNPDPVTDADPDPSQN